MLNFTEWKYDLKVQTDTIYVIGVLVGFGGSAMLITSLSITAELVGDNVESSAFIYGAMSFTDKLSTGKNNHHKYNHDISGEVYILNLYLEQILNLFRSCGENSSRYKA